MDIYNSVAGALVIGTMLLVGSGVLFVVTRIDQTRQFYGRGGAKVSAMGIARVLNVKRSKNRIIIDPDQDD